MKKHTHQDLYNTYCEKCESRAHSLDKDVTYLTLPLREKPYSIRIHSRVCLACGPILIFEVEKVLEDYLKEALIVAGYDLNDTNVEIQTV